MKLLLKFEDNWADEMDVYSYALVQDDIKEMWDKIESYSYDDKCNTDEVTIVIGSNEEIEYENVADLLSNITVTEITDEQAQAIESTLGAEWGSPDIESILYYSVLEALEAQDE